MLCACCDVTPQKDGEIYEEIITTLKKPAKKTTEDLPKNHQFDPCASRRWLFWSRPNKWIRSLGDGLVEGCFFHSEKKCLLDQNTALVDNVENNLSYEGNGILLLFDHQNWVNYVICA